MRSAFAWSATASAAWVVPLTVPGPKPVTAVPGLTPEIAVDRRRAGVGHRRAGEDREAVGRAEDATTAVAGRPRRWLPVRSALTSSGLRSGRAWSRSAAAPATTGAAIDVPPMRR